MMRGAKTAMGQAPEWQRTRLDTYRMLAAAEADGKKCSEACGKPCGYADVEAYKSTVKARQPIA
jgi:hypothetical protein